MIKEIYDKAICLHKRRFIERDKMRANPKKGEAYEDFNTYYNAYSEYLVAMQYLKMYEYIKKIEKI